MKAHKINRIKIWKIILFIGIDILFLKSKRIEAKEKNRKQESLWNSPRKEMPDHELKGIKNKPIKKMEKIKFLELMVLIF